MDRGEEVNPLIDAGETRHLGHTHTGRAYPPRLGEGATENDLLGAYPNLTAADIRAAMAYPAAALAHEDRV